MGSSSGPDQFQQDEEAREKEIEKEADAKNRQTQQDEIDELNRMRGGGAGGFSPASGGGKQTLGG